MTDLHKSIHTAADSSKTADNLAVNGTSIYYEDAGKGHPAMFSHGLLWNRSMFAAQVETLSTEFRCVAYDHRGQGLSADDTRDEIDVEVLCQDAIALIQQLNLAPVHFCGHSLGGFVGIMIAIRRPELLRSLVLCNTAADAERFGTLVKYKALNLVARLLGPAAVADALMPMMFGPSIFQDETKYAERLAWRKMIAENRKTIWRAANGVINRPSQFDQLAAIKVPTLVVTSDDDKLRTAQESVRLAAAIPNATIVQLRRGGHMLPLEEPEAVTNAIRQFWKSSS